MFCKTPEVAILWSTHISKNEAWESLFFCSVLFIYNSLLFILHHLWRSPWKKVQTQLSYLHQLTFVDRCWEPDWTLETHRPACMCVVDLQRLIKNHTVKGSETCHMMHLLQELHWNHVSWLCVFVEGSIASVLMKKFCHLLRQINVFVQLDTKYVEVCLGFIILPFLKQRIPRYTSRYSQSELFPFLYC